MNAESVNPLTGLKMVVQILVVPHCEVRDKICAFSKDLMMIVSEQTDD